MVIGITLLLIAIIDLLVGLTLLFRYERSQSATYYGLFALAVGLYVGANGFGYTAWFENNSVFETLAWTGGILTAVFFLPFSFSFPHPKKTLRELLPYVVWPMCVFVPGLVLTDVFIDRQSIVQFGHGYTTQTGDFFWLLLLCFAVYWGWGILNLVRSYRSSSGYYRWMIKIFLVGLFASLVISTIFDIVMPLTSPTRLGFVGSMFSSVWLLTTSYLMFRK